MTPRSERIILDRIADKIDKSCPIDSETLSGLREILLTSRKERAEKISLLMSLIRYRRAGYRTSKSTDERETAYTMGIVVGMQKMAEAYDERLATAEHKSNELSEGVSRHLRCIACLAPTRNAADSIIVRCRDCKHYTDHSINLHPHWCRKHGSYRISPDFFCAGGERKDGQKNF